ncbi:hypothetical protein [Methanogenium cariaci]|jgi:hypothetical protein|uniref:hypothetical protein n=1 Tax=Methanogenium cariaci TaxID=2197 RepID=UPI0012F67C68|nr:hypothetical protein [Methanogenium cariaci]
MTDRTKYRPTPKTTEEELMLDIIDQQAEMINELRGIRTALSDAPQKKDGLRTIKEEIK